LSPRRRARAKLKPGDPVHYELIRELIDRAIGGHSGADLAADLAAINDSFGIIAGQEAFSRAPDHRMGEVC
jgi:hypothetical protein